MVVSCYEEFESLLFEFELDLSGFSLWTSVCGVWCLVTVQYPGAELPGMFVHLRRIVWTECDSQTCPLTPGSHCLPWRRNLCRSCFVMHSQPNSSQVSQEDLTPSNTAEKQHGERSEMCSRGRTQQHTHVWTCRNRYTKSNQQSWFWVDFTISRLNGAKIRKMFQKPSMFLHNTQHRTSGKSHLHSKWSKQRCTETLTHRNRFLSLFFPGLYAEFVLACTMKTLLARSQWPRSAFQGSFYVCCSSAACAVSTNYSVDVSEHSTPPAPHVEAASSKGKVFGDFHRGEPHWHQQPEYTHMLEYNHTVSHASHHLNWMH